MFLNEVRLIGNLGGDAEKTTLQNGAKTKTTFQLATTKRWKNKETANTTIKRNGIASLSGAALQSTLQC